MSNAIGPANNWFYDAGPLGQSTHGANFKSSPLSNGRKMSLQLRVQFIQELDVHNRAFLQHPHSAEDAPPPIGRRAIRS